MEKRPSYGTSQGTADVRHCQLDGDDATDNLKAVVMLAVGFLLGLLTAFFFGGA
jgi:hypothetical protein